MAPISVWIKNVVSKKVVKAKKSKISLFRLFEEKLLRTKHNYKAKLNLQSEIILS